MFQRSSSNVEGRHGYLSLRNHQLRGLDHPRKRTCLTAVHNFFLTRPDGTTAAPQPVELGRSSVNTIEIIRGLKEGDRVVLSDMSQWDAYDHIRLK